MGMTKVDYHSLVIPISRHSPLRFQCPPIVRHAISWFAVPTTHVPLRQRGFGYCPPLKLIDDQVSEPCRERATGVRKALVEKYGMNRAGVYRLL